MLTVKYIRQDGSEELYACENVRYVPDDGSSEAFGSAGLYLDPEPAVPLSGDTGPESLPRSIMAKMAIPVSRARSAQDACSPKAFIMNANGATIASYPM